MKTKDSADLEKGWKMRNGIQDDAG